MTEPSKTPPGGQEPTIDLPAIALGESGETDRRLQETGLHAPAQNLDEGADAPPDLRSFGDYELEYEIARGGMGVVYRARQKSLDRPVALKMILSGRLAGEEELRRFHAEAGAAARLDHPNIVPIYEVGQHDGRHYFSMGLVEGRSLDDWIGRGPMRSEMAAAILRTTASAIAYAHSKGIVHRDLKPANILITEEDSSASQSLSPRITDFGLAKQVDGQSDLTASGQILGTPAYMAPEQAAGRTDQLGPTADIYALGAVGYAMVTGNAPHRGVTAIDTLRQVLERDPIPPRQINSGIPRDFETVVMKCLQKDPRKRYATAVDLVADLDRLISGDAIEARPISRLEKAGRWVYKHRAATGLAVAIASMILMLAIGGPILAFRESNARSQVESSLEMAKNAKQQSDLARLAAEAARQDAETQRLVAEEVSEKLSNQTRQNMADLYASEMHLAYQSWQDGAIKQMRDRLYQAPAEFRGWEWDYLLGLPDKDVTRLRHHSGVIVAGAWSRDGTRVISAAESGSVITSNLKGEIQSQRTLRGSSTQLSRYGDAAITGSKSLFGILDVDSDRLYHSIELRSLKVIQTQWSVDSRHAIAVMQPVEDAGKRRSEDDRNLVIRTITMPESIAERWTQTKANPFQSLPLAADQFVLLTMGQDEQQIWIADKLGRVNGFEGETLLWKSAPMGDAISALVISPDANRIAVGTVDGEVRILDAATGKVKSQADVAARAIRQIAWSPDGKQVAVAGEMPTVSLLEADSLEILAGYAAGRGLCNALRYSPDSSRLLYGGTNETLVWDCATDRHTGSPAKSVDQIVDMVAGQIADSIWILRRDGRVDLWDVRRRQSVRTIRQANGPLKPLDGPIGMSLAIDTSRNELAVAIKQDDESVIELWDTLSGRLRETLTTGAPAIHDLALNPASGHWVATVGRMRAGRDSSKTRQTMLADASLDAAETPSQILVWKTMTNKLTWQLGSRAPFWNSISILPEQSVIAVASDDGKITLWNLSDGQVAGELRTLVSEPIKRLAVNPEGSRLASTGNDGSIRIWNLSDRSLHAVLSGHTDQVDELRFLSDDRLATVGRDRSMRVWRMEFPAEVLRLPTETVRPTGMLVGQQRDSLIISAEDRDPQIWSASDRQTGSIAEGSVEVHDLLAEDASGAGTQIGEWVFEDTLVTAKLSQTINSGSGKIQFASRYFGDLVIPNRHHLELDFEMDHPSSVILGWALEDGSLIQLSMQGVRNPLNSHLGCVFEKIVSLTRAPIPINANSRVEFEMGQRHQIQIVVADDSMVVYKSGAEVLSIPHSSVPVVGLSLSAGFGIPETEVKFHAAVVRCDQAAQRQTEIATQIDQWYEETQSPLAVEHWIDSQSDWNLRDRDLARARLRTRPFDVSKAVSQAFDFLSQSNTDDPAASREALATANRIASDGLSRYPAETSLQLVRAAVELLDGNSHAGDGSMIDPCIRVARDKNGFVEPFAMRLKAGQLQRAGDLDAAGRLFRRAKKMEQFSQWKDAMVERQLLTSQLAVDQSESLPTEPADPVETHPVETQFVSMIKDWFLQRDGEHFSKSLSQAANFYYQIPERLRGRAEEETTAGNSADNDVSASGDAFRRWVEMGLYQTASAGEDAIVVIDKLRRETDANGMHQCRATVTVQFERGFSTFAVRAVYQSRVDQSNASSIAFELASWAVQPLRRRDHFSDPLIDYTSASITSDLQEVVASRMEPGESPAVTALRCIQWDALGAADRVLARSDPRTGTPNDKNATALRSLTSGMLSMRRGDSAAAENAFREAYQADATMVGDPLYRSFLARNMDGSEQRYLGRRISAAVPLRWRQIPNVDSSKAPGDHIATFRAGVSVIAITRVWSSDALSVDDLVFQVNAGAKALGVEVGPPRSLEVDSKPALELVSKGEKLKEAIGEDANADASQRLVLVPRSEDIVMVILLAPRGESEKEGIEFNRFIASMKLDETRQK